MKPITALPPKPPISPIKALLLLALIATSHLAKSQDYITNADGSWTTTIWNNTSGWGSATPPTTGQNSGSLTIANNVSVTGDLSVQNPALTINVGKTLTVNGNVTTGSGTTVTVSGTLHITGDLTISSPFNILPGGKVIVDGNLTVYSGYNLLTIGTNVAPGAYADLVVRKNFVSSNSGDVVINQNGRVAIFGNVTNDSAGGTLFTINNGGQVYIDGNVALVGGGDHVTNNNATNPWGFYVNGTTASNTSQGSDVSSNKADKATLQATNDPFWQWVDSQGTTPLPIELAIFRISNIDNQGITLTWITTTEINFNKFIIEHTTNGVDFEAIGTQHSLANNTNTRTTYTFTHTTPVAGRNYYRLKSVDLDTQYEYSAIVQGEYTGERTITLFPNPTKENHIILALNFAPSEGDNIQIFDMFGTSLQENRITNLQNRIDFYNDLKPGAYILKYTSVSNSRILRFVVR